MREWQPVVYIMASKEYGTLYTGVTSDLVRRVYQHKTGAIEGFSKDHNTKILVYYELHDDILIAIEREKRMKKWRRDWKLKLINNQNPQWQDLYPQIL